MKILLLIFASWFMIALQTPNSNSERNIGVTQSDSISVMSYNIRYDNPDDGINAWPNRSDHVAEMIGEKYQVDIIGVQEALKHQIDDLQERLPDYSWVGVGRDDGKEAGEFSPIFYKTERFDLIATNTFWLSESPHQPGSISWDAAITRVASWAKFRDRSNGREFYVINTHFDHMGEVARVESAKVIGDFISDIDEEFPVIVTGDFNVPETSEAYSVMTKVPGILDARYASESEHEGPTATFNDWEELRPEESRIDYIFVRDNVRVLTHQILDDRYDGRFPSDHSPFLSFILFDWNLLIYSTFTMNIEQYRNFCLSLPGATEDLPFDENTLCFKVMGKIFSICDIMEFESINLKCDPIKAIELREMYPEVVPGYHMNKKHWNTVNMQSNLPDELIEEWVVDSYNLVVEKLPNKDREKLNS